MEKFRKFWKYGFVGGSGGGPHRSQRKYQKITRKINGKRQSFETFHEILANFDLKKLILIKIKASLMKFRKDLIILTEFKKHSDIFLRIWAKNQLRFEIFEKILKFTCKNLNGKLIFHPFSHIFQDFCHFIHLCNIAKFLGLAWAGGVVQPGLGVLSNLGGVRGAV